MQPIFPLLLLGLALGSVSSSWACRLHVGSVRVRVGSARLIGYQHVLCWGYCPTLNPKAREFALQWNIGFTLLDAQKMASHENAFLKWQHEENIIYNP